MYVYATSIIVFNPLFLFNVGFEVYKIKTFLYFLSDTQEYICLNEVYVARMRACW